MIPPTDPAWWIEALEFEKAERFADAVAAIRRALDSRGEPSAAQIAELYDVRCRRLIALGQWEAARLASERGSAFMREYASGATSDGEGIALSQEADDYQAAFAELFASASARTGH